MYLCVALEVPFSGVCSEYIDTIALQSKRRQECCICGDSGISNALKEPVKDIKDELLFSSTRLERSRVLELKIPALARGASKNKEGVSNIDDERKGRREYNDLAAEKRNFAEAVPPVVL